MSEISSDKYDISDNVKLAVDLDDITFFQAVDSSITTPKIFPLEKYPLADGEEHQFIDGGEGKEIANKNNPSFSLVVEALRQGYKIENINLISIGAGKYGFPDTASDQEKIQVDAKMFW